MQEQTITLTYLYAFILFTMINNNLSSSPQDN